VLIEGDTSSPKPRWSVNRTAWKQNTSELRRRVIGQTVRIQATYCSLTQIRIYRLEPITLWFCKFEGKEGGYTHTLHTRGDGGLDSLGWQKSGKECLKPHGSETATAQEVWDSGYK
jgi:hypothetical protein